jgi:hypothetical protein
MADATHVDTIRTALLRRYLTMLSPAVVLFAVWAACRQAGLVQSLGLGNIDLVGKVVFISAIVLAVALPMFYRIRFVKSVEGSRNVSEEAFVPFQLTLMSLALIAPYVAAAGYIAAVSTFHFSGAFLASLYGAYYYFPSDRRVAQEMRLFRVSRDNGDN